MNFNIKGNPFTFNHNLFKNPFGKVKINQDPCKMSLIILRVIYQSNADLHMSLFMIVNAKIWRPFRETNNTWLEIPRTRSQDFLQVFHGRKLKINKKPFPNRMIFHFPVESIMQVISHVGYLQNLVYRLCSKTIFHEDYVGNLQSLSHIHPMKFLYKESPLWLQTSTNVVVKCCKYS